MLMYMDFPSWISPLVIPSLPIRWYAMMYIVAFATTYALFRYQCRQGRLNGMSSDDSLTLFLYVIGFLVIGARVFSTLLYEGNWYYWTHPWMIFWPFRDGRFVGLPGMSYHGGVAGAILGNLLFCRKYRYRFFDTADHVVAGIPLGYTFGRLGNFINGELWGRVTTKPFGMVFPDAPSFPSSLGWVREVADKVGLQYAAGGAVNLPRHPSQLYEALFEGVVLFIALWFLVRPIAYRSYSKHGPGLLSGCYFIGYGIVRFAIEYLREPDSQLGFIIAWGGEDAPPALFSSLLNITLGQLLCLTMILGGIAVIVYAKRTEPIRYPKVRYSNDRYSKDKGKSNADRRKS